MKAFIDWVNAKTDSQYSQFTENKIEDAKDQSSKAACEACDFTEEWNDLCENEAFIDWQHKFILDTHYTPVYSHLTDLFGGTKLFAALSEEEEEALKEMCISLGVQHGGAKRIFKMALMHDYSECTDDQILSTTDADCSPALGDYPANGENSQSQKDTMKAAANEISMSEFADRVYAARKLYIKAAGLLAGRLLQRTDTTRKELC